MTRPMTLSDVDSIRASGVYRSHLDDALDDMARSDFGETRPKDAEALRSRASTCYRVESIEEAEALAEAATFVLNGGPSGLDPTEDRNGLTVAQEEAVERVRDEAQRTAEGLREEAARVLDSI